MPNNPQTTEGRLHDAVVRLNVGDESAIEDLLSHIRRRLEVITRGIRNKDRDLSEVARWYATDDVVQEASLRLARTLRNEPVNTGDHFLRLAAMQIRWTLKNLFTHTTTKSHFSATYKTDPTRNERESDGVLGTTPAQTDAGFRWDKFLDRFNTLTEEQRNMLDDIFFNGCTQQEAADRLKIGITAFKQRWLKLKLQLCDEGFSGFN